MTSFQFTKMHGLGNNYIYVNQMKEQLPEEQLSEIAIRVSSVYTGIGSDGMILICPSDVAAVKMRIFNNDGSEGKNCGNGLRCVAKYVYEHQIVTDTTFQIETLSGLVEATVHIKDDHVQLVTVDMGKPRFEKEAMPMLGEPASTTINEALDFGTATLNGTAVSMGNPHIVFYLEDIEKAPLDSLGPIIEKHDMFPEGVNVEFVERVSETELHFRVWERGSGITQACGTGACAAAVSTIVNGHAKKETDMTVHLAGGDLNIRWKDNDHVLMTGPAETICDGTFYL
ncbi:diaminopimelate epimerase [Bacillus zhangzhouensis]|uniref:diaminopimelate epimerase n=1 Tax=Bacillus zhangzhouensis TaxID=1178540 RepID=UPI003D1D5DFE